MIINGKERILDKPMTIQALLNGYMLNKNVVVIHVNGQVVPTDQYSTVVLTNEDTVKLVTISAGG